MPLDRPLDDDWIVGPGGLRLSAVRRRVFVAEREITLTKTTFDVLALLLRRQGAVVTIDELVREVWGYESAGRPGFARTAVYRLRKELSHAGVGNVIEAIRGVGFRIPDPFPETPGQRAPAGLLDLQNALMFASTAIVVASADQKVLWANHAAERVTGYSLAELRGLASTAQLAGGDNPTVYAKFREMLAAGRTLRGPSKTRRKDGSVVDLPASWKPVFDEQGQLQYTIVEFWVGPANGAETLQAG